MWLQNNILNLRALEPSDLDILYIWENRTDLWIHGNSLTPYSRLALREYIRDTQQTDIYQAKQLRLIIELKADKNVIGCIDIYDFDFHNQRAGIGILIDEKFRNMGYASLTLKLIEEYSFRFLNINQLYAYIASDNLNSIELFERNKYQKSGLLKDWIKQDMEYKDVYIYQLIKNE